MTRKGPSVSILKSKWGAMTFAEKNRPYDHKFERQVIDASVIFGQSDKHTEFTLIVHTLLCNMQKVDGYIQLAPVKRGMISPSWRLTTSFSVIRKWASTSWRLAETELSEWKKTWKGHNNNNKDLNKEELIDPEVCFVFYVSTAEEPVDLLGKVSVKWRKSGGKTLA